MKEYLAESYWTGFWGGWGAVAGLQQRINERARIGWRLISTKSTHCLYYWLIPRPKLLLIYERDIPDVGSSVESAPVVAASLGESVVN